MPPAQPDAPVGDLDVGEDVCDGKLLLQALRGLVLVRGEGRDVDQPGDAVVRSRGVMTVPPYEWPTRMAGLLTRPSARLTAATSPFERVEAVLGGRSPRAPPPAAWGSAC